MRISDWSSDVCSSDLLNAARPTAVNLAWALARMRRALAGAGDDWRDMLEREARAIEVEDLAANRRMGELGAGLIEPGSGVLRSEEHTSELQSLMRISYAVFCLKKKNKYTMSTAITKK